MLHAFNFKIKICNNYLIQDYNALTSLLEY